MSVRFRAVCSEWRPSSPGFSAGARVDERLPADYLELVRVVGPGEGSFSIPFDIPSGIVLADLDQGYQIIAFEPIDAPALQDIRSQLASPR